MPPTTTPIDYWKHQLAIGFFPGKSGGDNKWGLGMQYTLFYRWRRYAQFGSSVGVQSYEMEAGTTFYPLMAEVKGNLLRDVKWKPYYTGGAGYSFAFQNERENISEAQGGLCWRAGIGVSKVLETGLTLVMDLNYQFQKGQSVQENELINERLTRNYRLNRISLRVAFVFSCS